MAVGFPYGEARLEVHHDRRILLFEFLCRRAEGGVYISTIRAI
jgi:hypothetical protein